MSIDFFESQSKALDWSWKSNEKQSWKVMEKVHLEILKKLEDSFLKISLIEW